MFSFSAIADNDAVGSDSSIFRIREGVVVENSTISPEFYMFFK